MPRKTAAKPKQEKEAEQPKEKRSLSLDILGLAMAAVGLFAFISLLRDGTGLLGQGLRTVFFGLFGVGAYVAALLVTAGGALLLLSYVFRLKPVDYAMGLPIFWLMLAVLHLVGAGGLDATEFIAYTGDSFLLGREIAGGGFFGGVLLWPLLELVGRAGAWITTVLLLLILILVWTGVSVRRMNQRVKETVTHHTAQVRRTREWERSRQEVREFANLRLEDLEPEPELEPEGLVPPVYDAPVYTPKTPTPRPVREKKAPPPPPEPEETSSAYAFPPVALLSHSRNPQREDPRARAQKLEQTLASFGVRGKVTNISCGPAVTQFEIQPAPGVRVNSITNISNDIALSLAAPSIRIEAPIPGKSAVGVEIPNEAISTVKLRDVLDTDAFLGLDNPVAFCLGRNIVGENVFTDISKMPHLLIAGATGSGKSVCINSLIISLLYKATPQQVRLMMIDPKVVELGVYNGIPHLLIPVVTEPKKAAGALHWAVQEMERRYQLFSDKRTRNIQGYNKLVEPEEALPYIIIIIDELADLMMVAPGDVEDAICRIAQLARAAGMHLVIATQRPSVDVITGLIKANIPSRIAFAVSSGTDSRTILDSNGAEKLLGRGDMLYAPTGSGKTQRVQGCFITEEEVEDVVAWILERQEETESPATGDIQAQVDSFEVSVKSGRKDRGQREEGEEGTPVLDALLPDVIDRMYDQGQISISMVQRKMGVGYARAARIVDQLESLGIVAEGSGAKPRNFLKTRQEIEELLGER